jgi:uncharacterized protein (TIGR04141 family)
VRRLAPDVVAVVVFPADPPASDGSVTRVATSTTRKTSLYRLRHIGPLQEVDLGSYVMPKYVQRDAFAHSRVNHDGVDGFVIWGTIANGDAAWCGPLGNVVGLPVAAQNQTALALLVLRTGKAVYALTSGLGHLMIDGSRIDPGFGIDFAVRCLDVAHVSRVRRQVMDARGRTDENSATGGEHIDGFGIEQFGEIVSHISGTTLDVELTFCRERNRPAHVVCSDRSMKLPLGTTTATLLADLEEIERVCARPTLVPELEFIAQVRPLPAKSEQGLRLDVLLDGLLDTSGTDRLALAVPTACRDRYDLAESFVLTLRDAVRVAELTIEDVIGLVAGRPDGLRLSALRGARIQMFAGADGSECISTQVRADHWLTAEVTDGGAHYFYWQGQWYEIGAEYLSVVEKRVAELLARAATVVLPPWPLGEDEGTYNERIAAQQGFVLLDKKTVHTKRFRGGGLEIADALGPGGELVCVKKADGTAALNHLFAQGRVAVETLRFDGEVREKFLAKIPDDHPVDRAFRTPTVVFGIMLKDGVPLTVDSLFAFAKVSLLHAATALQAMGCQLEIVSIGRPQPDEPAVPVQIPK